MELNDKNFETTIANSKLPFLIEFWASWCVPCQMMGYLLKEIAIEFEGKINIGRLNIDRNRKAPKIYNITGVPTFIGLKGSEIIEKRIGALSKTDLIQIIDNLLL